MFSLNAWDFYKLLTSCWRTEEAFLRTAENVPAWYPFLSVAGAISYGRVGSGRVRSRVTAKNATHTCARKSKERNPPPCVCLSVLHHSFQASKNFLLCFWPPPISTRPQTFPFVEAMYVCTYSVSHFSYIHVYIIPTRNWSGLLHSHIPEKGFVKPSFIFINHLSTLSAAIPFLFLNTHSLSPIDHHFSPPPSLPS